MPPPDPRDPDDFSDSDLEWLDRIGPSPRPPAQTPAQREGDRLKAAMQRVDADLLARPEVQAALGDEARRARLREVMARLDAPAADVSPAPAPAPSAAPSPAPSGPDAASSPAAWWRRLSGVFGGLVARPWPAAAALAMAVVASTVIVPTWMNQPAYQRPDEVKGADDVRRVAVERPRQAAEAFAAELSKAGLKPGLFQRDKTFIVDIDVDRPLLAAATPAFTRIGLEPRLGFTRVEFAPRP